nr:hypothetical protein [Tanacetum cinerariifolium]
MVRFRSSSPLGSTLHDTTISSIEIATTSTACISTPVIIASPAIRRHIRTTVRKSMLGLGPVMTLARSAALRRARQVTLSLKTSSSNISSRSSSDLALASSSFAGLSLERGRYRGTSAMHSDESSDEGSPVTQAESDMDSDIRAEVEVVTATAATAIVDGLGIEPVLAGFKAGFEPGLAVVETERIDIPHDFPMPDAMERLGQLEEGMQAIEELISRRVEEALAAQEANRNAGLLDENQSQNGDDNDNGSGGNGNHGNNNRDGNQNGGNGGVVGLARWFEKMKSVLRISNFPPNYQVKFATCTLLDKALTWWNSHVQTIGIDEAYEMPWKDLMKLMIEVYCLRNEI